MSERFACVTDYNKNYAVGYYGHAPGTSSFDVSKIPALLAGMCDDRQGVADLGGGNGMLGAELKKFNVRSITVDPGAPASPGFIRADLAVPNDDAMSTLRSELKRRLGNSYLTTCLDVAEHIDIEHIANFLCNLRMLTVDRVIFSVSTRPSSSGNRYHSSILPIETWKKILRICGFEVSVLPAFDALRSDRVYDGSSENLIAVSHWQRRNPFRDHLSHKHYLLLRPIDGEAEDRMRCVNSVATFLDISYRQEKRRSVEDLDARLLIFNVTFIQDWSFARSLMDVWPSDKFKILLRKDTIVPQYLSLIRNICVRNGIDFAEIETVEQGTGVLSGWYVDRALFATASEGIVSITHLIGSLLALEARKMGFVTVTLQHGLNIPKRMTFAAENVAAWDAKSGEVLSAMDGAGETLKVAVTGSPKIQDCRYRQDGAALATRLGAWTDKFDAKILVGLNLHWTAVNNADDVRAWLARTVAAHPNVLFVLRPHPDDASIYDFELPGDNVLIIDELVLICIHPAKATGLMISARLR